MPRNIARTFDRHNAVLNRSNSMWARGVYSEEDSLAISDFKARSAIATLVGCKPEEIALTRSGTDALQNLIVNYRNLAPGDAVICCDLDYDSGIAALEWLGMRRGIEVTKFNIPEPATTANILASYEDVLRRTPRAKLLLVTHVSHRTGLVMPVREIVAIARSMGVDAIVDAAHSVACLDFKLDDLGADFVCWAAHKWMSAPLGTGAIYIRESRLSDIDFALGKNSVPSTDIHSRVIAGPGNYAAIMTIPAAVEFHFAVGASPKEQHLRCLRNRWVDAVRDLDNVEICVPDDAERYCTITSFRLRGMNTEAKATRLQNLLFQKYRLHTVARGGASRGPVIRVTPGLYTRDVDVDVLSTALRTEHALFA